MSAPPPCGLDRPNICADGGFSLDDREANVVVQPTECLDSAFGLDLRKGYLRRAIGIAFEFNVASGWYSRDMEDIARYNEAISSHPNEALSVCVEDLERWVSASPKDRTDGSVLIGNIKVVQDANCLSPPPRKGLVPSKQIFYPGAGRLNSVNLRLKSLPVITNRKHQLFVLCAPINPNDAPNYMVEDTTKIVDSVAYYDRENIGDIFDKSDLNDWLAGIGIVLNRKSVRLAQYKGFELPFKVGNVEFCSFELESSASQHE